jgi:ABC-type uncharacterized transport system YnjBCD permease subunit
MSASLQLVVVGALVALALGYILRATWRTWFGAGKPACASGCGKCADPAPAAEAKGRRPLPMA